jgi:hypothetical protein
LRDHWRAKHGAFVEELKENTSTGRFVSPKAGAHEYEWEMAYLPVEESAEVIKAAMIPSAADPRMRATTLPRFGVDEVQPGHAPPAGLMVAPDWIPGQGSMRSAMREQCVGNAWRAACRDAMNAA